MNKRRNCKLVKIKSSVFVILTPLFSFPLVLLTILAVLILAALIFIPIIIKKRKTNKEPEEIKIVKAYYYSFQARLHLNSLEASDRYNKIKNFLLNFQDVRVEEKWQEEKFYYGHHLIAKVRLREDKTFLYLAINPDNYINRYDVKDVRYTNFNDETPTLFVVEDMKTLKESIILIERMMIRLKAKDVGYYQFVDYSLKQKSYEQLVDEGQIEFKYVQYLENN